MVDKTTLMLRELIRWIICDLMPISRCQCIVPSPEAVNAVNFDGATGLLIGSGGLAGAVDGKEGIVSFWFKMQGGDGTQMFLLDPDSSALGSVGFQIIRQSSNVWQISGLGTDNLIKMSVRTLTTFTSGGGWHHFLASWNNNTATMQLYIDGADNADPVVSTNANIAYASGRSVWEIGSFDTLSDFFLQADIADFYVNFATSMDLTNSANRAKFITGVGGTPVALGEDGSLPTGSLPIIYVHGPTASWQTNKGSGGGFTMSGTLTTASTHP